LNELTAICAVAETEETTHRPQGSTTVLQHQTYNVETVTVKWVIMRGQICEPPGSQKLRLSSVLVLKIICYDKNIYATSWEQVTSQNCGGVSDKLVGMSFIRCSASAIRSSQVESVSVVDSSEGKTLAPNFVRVCADRDASEGKTTRFDCRVTGPIS